MKPKIKFYFTGLLCLLLLSACEMLDINAFSGKLTGYTDCGKKKNSNLSRSSCINYSYNESKKTLYIEHINAAFNCCPDSLSCYVTLNENFIVIYENEIFDPSSAHCLCQCLYDLNIKLKGIEPQVYQIRIGEPYLGDQEELCFEIDLSLESNGSYCVSRSGYPWI
jgi:hypothetical protein